jgi:hypothetical protein
MFYLIYKITNLINGKIYIGSHKTTNINDTYMGSGKYLLYAQQKYGIKNFKKDILFVFDNSEDMFNKEAELVNETFLSEENTYNLKLGGAGGFGYINSSGKNLYGNNGKPGYGGENLSKGWHRPKSNEEVVRISKTLNEGYKSGRLTPSFLGRNHTIDTIQKLKGHTRQQGDKNSQYGTKWVHNSTTLESKKVRTTDSLEEGWILGRIPKKQKEPYVNLAKLAKRKENVLLHEQYYKIYSAVGFTEFVKITGYKSSQPNLVQQFARLLDRFESQNGKRRG